jgi:hypothetical protein
MPQTSLQYASITKFRISSYQEILCSGIFKETPYECATFFIKLLTASQDLHELHIRNFKSQCNSSYKSELRLGCFLLKTFFSRHYWQEAFGYLLVNSHMSYWYNENSQKNSTQQGFLPQIFNTECAIKLQGVPVNWQNECACLLFKKIMPAKLLLENVINYKKSS